MQVLRLLCRIFDGTCFAQSCKDLGLQCFSSAFKIDLLPMNFDDSCAKHSLQATYKSLLSEFRQLHSIAKVIPEALQQVKSNLQNDIQNAYGGYMTKECKCCDMCSTVRLGGSWASQLGEPSDVANLADLEDYAHHFSPSRN